MLAVNRHDPKPLIESVEKLFLRFLVGTNCIYKEGEYDDGLLEIEAGEDEPSLEEESGWNQRILLEVEKKRVERQLAEQRKKNNRNAKLTRYFQELLLKVVNENLDDSDKVIRNQSQYQENAVELLTKLLATEPRYSVLASLLKSNTKLHKRLLLLVGSEVFMGELDRSPREVRDVHSAIGLIGTDVLRFLIPAILFKNHIAPHGEHNPLFAKKLWRYQMTLGQTCCALMKQAKYRRPYEGMLLSAMVNFSYVSGYQQYITSFEVVRTACLEKAKEDDQQGRHDFFLDLQTDPASLQALLISKADLALSLSISGKIFHKKFPHLVNALREEVEQLPFESRSTVGKILFKAIRFAKYEQLRSARLFKAQWLNEYLHASELDMQTFKMLLRAELFHFRPIW